MTVVPNFLLKRLYIAGSLRQEAEGVAFDLINVLGPGMFTGFNGLKLNDAEVLIDQIRLKIQDHLVKAAEITENNPLTVLLNQTVTCFIEGAKLDEGNYKITLDLLSKEAGKVVVSVQDTLS